MGLLIKFASVARPDVPPYGVSPLAPEIDPGSYAKSAAITSLRGVTPSNPGAGVTETMPTPISSADIMVPPASGSVPVGVNDANNTCTLYPEPLFERTRNWTVTLDGVFDVPGVSVPNGSVTLSVPFEVFCNR